MPEPSESTPVRRLRAGDEEAFREVWTQHYRRLRGLVMRKLAAFPVLAGKESDIAVQAMHQFFVRAVAGRFSELGAEGAVWKLLRTIAARKINDELKYARADKRGGGRKSAKNADSQPPAGTRRYEPVEWLQDRRAVQADGRVNVDDLFEHLLARLPDDISRRIILMRLHGVPTAEIAEKLEISTRSVQRRLQEIERWWTTEFLDDSP